MVQYRSVCPFVCLQILWPVGPFTAFEYIKGKGGGCIAQYNTVLLLHYSPPRSLQKKYRFFSSRIVDDTDNTDYTRVGTPGDEEHGGSLSDMSDTSDPK